MILKSGKLLPCRIPEASLQGVLDSMRSRRWSLAILAGCVAASLALAGCSTMHDMHASDPELHSHTAEHNEHSDRDALLLDDDNKWSIDEPLRINMQAINELMIPSHATAPDHMVNGEQGKAIGLKAIGLKVQQQVDFMVANCELASRCRHER